MASLKETRYLLAPPYCQTAETYISPITSSAHEIIGGSSIAGGWAYFNSLKVIQKKNNSMIVVKMTTKELLNTAKKANKFCLREAESHLEKIMKKRLPFSNLDMSKPHIMGVINLTPDSFYKIRAFYLNTFFLCFTFNYVCIKFVNNV